MNEADRWSAFVCRRSVIHEWTCGFHLVFSSRLTNDWPFREHTPVTASHSRFITWSNTALFILSSHTQWQGIFTLQWADCTKLPKLFCFFSKTQIANFTYKRQSIAGSQAWWIPACVRALLVPVSEPLQDHRLRTAIKINISWIKSSGATARTKAVEVISYWLGWQPERGWLLPPGHALSVCVCQWSRCKGQCLCESTSLSTLGEAQGPSSCPQLIPRTNV